MLADISMEVVLEMLFLTLSSADIRFAERKLVWRRYAAEKPLSTSGGIEIIDQFATAAFRA